MTKEEKKSWVDLVVAVTLVFGTIILFGVVV